MMGPVEMLDAEALGGACILMLLRQDLGGPYVRPTKRFRGAVPQKKRTSKRLAQKLSKGTRIQVYWRDSGPHTGWWEGKIKDTAGDKNGSTATLHQVAYKDASVFWHNLTKEQWRQL